MPRNNRTCSRRWAVKTELNSTLQGHFAISLSDQSMFVRNQGQLDAALELLDQSIEITGPINRKRAQSDLVCRNCCRKFCIAEGSSMFG